MPARDYFNSATSLALGVLIGAVGVGTGAYLTRGSWLPILSPTAEAKKEDPHAGPDHGPPGERVKLSVHAQANLGLVVDALIPESYERMLTIPGTVEDRPGISDRNVISPLAGVVTVVNVQPGDTLQSGEILFTIRILSEAIQTAQTELFKATKDLQLTSNNLKLLREIPKGGIAESKIIEVENQEQKLKTAVTAARQDLLSRGFRVEQIDAVAGGKFLVEVTVIAPKLVDSIRPVANDTPKIAQASNGESTPTFELKELKVQVGEQVQAGQVLSVLANHRQLYIEGRGFKSESALLAKAAQNGWLVRAEFNEEGNEWDAYSGELKIRQLANTVDPVSRAFAFYIPSKTSRNLSCAMDRHFSTGDSDQGNEFGSASRLKISRTTCLCFRPEPSFVKGVRHTSFVRMATSLIASRSKCFTKIEPMSCWPTMEVSVPASSLFVIRPLP